MRLIQKQGLKRKEFEIREDHSCIDVLNKSKSGTKKWTINLEDLGSLKMIEESSKFPAWITGGVFLSFAIFFLSVFLANGDESLNLWSVISISSFFAIWGIIILLMPNKKEVHLHGGIESLTFFLDSPSEKEVNLFIDNIIKFSKQTLLKKYGEIDIDLPEETMLNQLNFLKNRNVITEIEYQELKKEYKTKRIIH